MSILVLYNLYIAPKAKLRKSAKTINLTVQSELSQ